MATTITINSSVTLDESPGLQTGGTAVGTEDNNDNDINPADLPSSFKQQLEVGLSLTSYTGAARSADGMITVSSDGTLNNLGFTSSNGTAHGGTLPTYTTGALGTAGSASNLSAVNGGSIGLFADAVLGNRMVLGVDGAGQIVFALFMEPNSALTSARIWMAQYEPIINTVTTNPDDPMSLSGLGVGASGTLNFNFNALPSGQNLFGMVGSSSDGLVVIGEKPVPNGTTYSNTSNTINTSQGGGPTTIGINNQMFDAGDGAYFTFVKNPVTDFLAGAVNGLNQNEADNVANIQYGATAPVSTSYTVISQTQGNTAASMSISAFDITDAPQGSSFIGALGTGAVNITAVRVYDSFGILATGITPEIVEGVATVSGLRAGFKVEWDTATPHDQVLVKAVAGKFDIGGFGTVQGVATSTPLTGVRFEDDGPSITASAVGAPTLTADDSTLGTNPSGSFSAQFTPVFGTDGESAAPRSYALFATAGPSGLLDTATGQAVILSLVSGQVQGRTADSDALVFTVSVVSTGPDAGTVTLDQLRAIKHPNPSSDDESVTLAAANLVVLSATAVDGDGDAASAPLNIGQLLVFKDDGPTMAANTTGAPTLTVDDSSLMANATGNFAAQFTPTYGADGAGAAPLSYALSATAGPSGLFDTASGQAVNLSVVSGQVQGRTATGGDLVFTVSVVSTGTGAGTVTLDQIRAVKHPNISSNDESVTLSAANLVVLTATAIDGDDDSDSAPLDIGQLLEFKDDGPTIGNINSSIVNFVKNASTGPVTLNGVVGADISTAPYTVTKFTPGITVNGVELQGVLSTSAQEVTYWANTNQNTTFGDAGDTAYYKLTLGQAGAGNYTFDVLVDPPPANTDFNFNALPSGQNLFGTVGTAATGLVVFGKTPIPSGTGYTNASDTINTSQGGGPTTIGINNQMFDQGEGAYFTFVKNPVADFLAGAPNGLNQNEADNVANMRYDGGTLEVKTGYVVISQTQGNVTGSMSITAFNISDSPQGADLVSARGTGEVDITAVRVFNGDTQITTGITTNTEGGVATVSGLRAGFKVVWDTANVYDQVRIEATGGKFDIGGFGTTQGADTPDQLLAFEAQVTDGDGDTALDDFTIGIDGTGIYDDGAVSVTV